MKKFLIEVTVFSCLTRRDFLKFIGVSSLGLLFSGCKDTLPQEISETTPNISITTDFSKPSLTTEPTSTALSLATETSSPSPTSPPTSTATSTSSPTPIPTSLRDFADLKGVKIYALVLYEAYSNKKYKDVILKTANGLMPGSTIGADAVFEGVDWRKILDNWPSYEEMLDNGVVPDEARLKWKSPDERLSFAERYHMDVMANHLLYAEQISTEMMEACKTKEDFAKIVKYTTKARVLHFKGRIKIWSGVNEITMVRLYNNKTPKTAFIKQMVDNDLIHNVYVWMKEADPDTIGLLSESWVVEATSDPKYQNVHDEYFRLLDDLISKATPVAGGGMHNHFWVYDPPQPDFVRSVINEFQDRGKVAYATETDVSMRPVFPLGERRKKRVTSLADPLEAQAKIFVDMLDVFVSTGNIFGMFGVTDTFSWYDDSDEPNLSDIPGAHIFDREYQPKPAYTQMVEYLKSFPGKA